MTPPPPRCPGGKRFRTERYARRYAWGQESNPELRPTPVQCEAPECGGAWHLVAPNNEARPPHLPAQDAETDRTGDRT